MLADKNFPKGTFILFLSFVLLLIVIYFAPSPTKNNIPQELIAVLRSHAVPIQPFTLTGKNGQPFTTTNLKSKWSFIFFGYTSCPDVCPTTLSTLKHIGKALKKNNPPISDTQVIFVSIDPDRDKPDMLAKYTAYFSKEFIPVTGTADNLLGFSKQFSAAYMKEKTKSSDNYLINHTSSIFLIDPKMRIIASFSPPHDAKTITEQYLKIHDMF